MPRTRCAYFDLPGKGVERSIATHRETTNLLTLMPTHPWLPAILALQRGIRSRLDGATFSATLKRSFHDLNVGVAKVYFARSGNLYRWRSRYELSWFVRAHSNQREQELDGLGLFLQIFQNIIIFGLTCGSSVAREISIHQPTSKISAACPPHTRW